MAALEDVISDLEKATNFSRKQIYERIREKHDELSGLVSMEGAAHLVARDMGINVLKPYEREFKLRDVKPGMRNLNFKARIVQITDIREFNRKDGSVGRVCNLMLSDGTGEVRLPLWDKQVEMTEKGILSEGDVVEVKDAFSRENPFSGVEVRLSKLARIEKVEDDEEIPRVEFKGGVYDRILISNAREGDHELMGTLIQIFDTNPIFTTCPTCRKKVERTEEGHKCQEHGVVEPLENLVISGIVDDGTGSMRAVFFREQAEAISGLEPKSLSSLSREGAMKLIRENALGSEVTLRGRVRKNKLFDTLEFLVNETKELNVHEEIKRLIDEIESFKRV